MNETSNVLIHSTNSGVATQAYVLSTLGFEILEIRIYPFYGTSWIDIRTSNVLSINMQLTC